METGTDPTLLALISTLIVIMVGNIWHQNREHSKTRDLLNALRVEFDGKLGALEKRMDTKIGALDTKIDALDKKVDTKIGALEKRVDTKIGALDKRVDSKVGSLATEVGSLTTEVAKLSGRFLEFKTATEKHLRMTDESIAELKVAVASNGERLARIEGHLGIGIAEAAPVK